MPILPAVAPINNDVGVRPDSYVDFVARFLLETPKPPVIFPFEPDDAPEAKPAPTLLIDLRPANARLPKPCPFVAWNAIPPVTPAAIPPIVAPAATPTPFLSIPIESLSVPDAISIPNILLIIVGITFINTKHPSINIKSFIVEPLNLIAPINSAPSFIANNLINKSKYVEAYILAHWPSTLSFGDT